MLIVLYDYVNNQYVPRVEIMREFDKKIRKTLLKGLGSQH
jgi:hypothetical protein